MEFYAIRTPSGHLQPCYDNDIDNLKKVPLNEPILLTYKKQRNPKFHRKFFSLVNLVYMNQEVYNNIDHLRKHLTIAAGYYDVTATLEGAEVKEAKSISFSKMDDVQFSEFYSKFIDVIHEYFGFDKEELINEVERFF